MRENRLIKPSTFPNLASTTLYGKRFTPYFCELATAGMNKDNKPFICSLDLLGCIGHLDDFAVADTCEESLLGTCETFFKPNMERDELFETVSQALSAAHFTAIVFLAGVPSFMLSPRMVYALRNLMVALTNSYLNFYFT